MFDSLSWILSVHGGLLAVAVGAFYKYGDRSENFAKSLAGTTTLLRSLRMSMSGVLSDDLRNFFRGVDTVPSLILDASGRSMDGITYSEKAANTCQSELFGEVVRKFIDGNAESLGDYRIVFVACSRWLFWMTWLSWTVLGLLYWQCIVTFLLAIVKVTGVVLSTKILLVSLTPSVFFGVMALFALPFALYSHDQIMRQRIKYDRI